MSSSSILRVIYPRQNLVLIMIYVLVGCWCPPWISRSTRIYETLAQTPKIIKNIYIYTSSFFFVRKLKVLYLEWSKRRKNRPGQLSKAIIQSYVFFNFFLIFFRRIIQSYVGSIKLKKKKKFSIEEHTSQLLTTYKTK